MKKLIDQANENLARAIEIFKENEDALDYMDLKLHSAFYYSSDIKDDFPELEDDENDLFYWYCEDTYNQMIEDFKERGYDFDKREYVGRTSSFYLDKDYQTDYKFTYMDDLLTHIVDKHGYNDAMPDIEDGKINENDPYLEYEGCNIGYIASEDFIKDLEGDLAPIIGMYSYIKDVKDNQVKYFKEYLANRQEIVIYEKEKEEERNLKIWLDGVSSIVA